LEPFARRFSHGHPSRPVTIRGRHAENTYAWIMTLEDRLIVNGTASYGSIAFNELWRITPRSW
jgi:uncharacterized protein